MNSFITTEEWHAFTIAFFKVDPLWLAHVQRNWNHLKNEPSCSCIYGNADYISFCLDYVEMRDAIEEQKRIELQVFNADDDKPLGENSEIY